MFYDAFCSKCGRKVSFDSSRQFMFCSYCGTKIDAPSGGGNIDVVKNNFVQTNTSPDEVYKSSLFSLASSYEASGNFNAAIEIYNKILQNDPMDVNARAALAKINTVFNTPNIIVTRVPYDVSGIVALPVRLRSSTGNVYPVRYLRKGETISYSVPPATYSLYLGKTGPRFTITDRYTSVKYSVTVFGSRVHANREY